MLTASFFFFFFVCFCFCESSFASVSSFISIIIICLLPQKAICTENVHVFCVV